MFERLDDSAELIDVRGVMAAASAYAVLGGVTRVHHEALGAFPLGLALMVYVLAAGRFARRSGPGWIWPTARDSVLAAVGGLAWIAAEASAAAPVRAAVPPPEIVWPDTSGVALQPPGTGMTFSISDSCYHGPDPLEVAAGVGAAGMAVGMGAVLIGGVARWLLRLQQETVDG